jgi:hypothetical protein
VTSQAQKAADLEHREENAVPVDDDVVDRADPLVTIVHDGAARQLARTIALVTSTTTSSTACECNYDRCAQPECGCAGGLLDAEPDAIPYKRGQ